MIRQVVAVNWGYIGDALPSFVTICFIPFSYSVAYGLIALVFYYLRRSPSGAELTSPFYRGIFVYTVINSLIWIVMFVSGGELEPWEYNRKEYWTWKPAGRKPWLFRVFTKGQYWAEERLHLKKDGSDVRSIQRQSATESEEKPLEDRFSAASVSMPPRAALL